MADNPDNANLRTINKPGTIRGVTISFLILGFCAISLRLLVRFKARLWGWDDLFVVLAGLVTIIGSSLACLMPDYGMGLHLWTLNDHQLTEYFKHIWSSNTAYVASTTLIKLAILFQYLRLFDMQIRTARLITIILSIMIALWGTIFFLLALFSCRPIAKNWNSSLKGSCVAWGSKDPDIFFATWAAHAALNMFFDSLVFLLPLPFLKGLRMQGKTRMGLIGLFVMGAIVVTVSVARMIALSVDRAGTVPILDMTYSTPAIYIFSVLEINIAILCASIPIFWPLVSSLAANKILVVNEIEVRTDRRDSQGIALAEQGSNPGCIGIPGLGKESDGKTNRMSKLNIIGGATKEYGGKEIKLVRHPSKSHTRYHRSNPSTHTHKKGYSTDLSATRRSSHESQRNLAHHSSNGDLSSASSTPPGQECPLDPPRSGSVTHYQDGYVQDWVVPDFQGKGVGNGKGGVTTTVERATIPFNHIKAHENS